MDNKKKFEIDIGNVYLGLKKQYRNFSDEFINTVIDYLDEVLLQHYAGLDYTRIWDDFMIQHFYPVNPEPQKNKIPYCFLLTASLGTMEIDYSKKVILKNSHKYFPLFFTLKFLFTNIIEGKEFLNFHFENSFNNDANVYKQFLEGISIKYKELLGYKQEKLLDIYLQDLEDPEATPIRKILSIHFLLDHLQIRKSNEISKKAKYIQYLTNIDSGTKKIKDSNLWHKVKKIDKLIIKAKKEDLVFIKKQFISLDLSQDIITTIQKEIDNK